MKAEDKATYTIYTLSCPNSGDVKYIGVTKQNLKSRLYKHIHEAKNYQYINEKRRWIKEVKIPIIETLDTTTNLNDSYNLEMYWISQFKTWGFNLLNLTDGGKGSIGFKHSNESRVKITKANRSRHPEKVKNKPMNRVEIEKLRIKNVKVEIAKYDLDGNFICSFNSIKEACQNKKMLISNITNVADRNKIAYGFFWRRKINNKFPDKIDVKPVIGNRTILKYTDLDTGKEEIFKSIAEAEKILGIQKHKIQSILKNQGKYDFLNVSFEKINPTKSIYKRR